MLRTWASPPDCGEQARQRGAKSAKQWKRQQAPIHQQRSEGLTVCP